MGHDAGLGRLSVMVDVYDTTEHDVIRTLEQLAELGLDADPTYD